MSVGDIRWIQRYNNFCKAFDQLQEAVELLEQRKLSKLEEQGLIQSFEYTYELVWNTIKDYFEAQGETGIHGSRDAFRLAFRRGLIENGKTWMAMIKSRTLTTHTYNQEIAEEIVTAIASKYYPEFVALRTKLQNIKDKNS